MAMDPDEADRLLDGRPADPTHSRLANLLHSAAGPARPLELAGEDRVLAGFRQGRSPAGSSTGRRPAGSSPDRTRRRVALLAGVLAAALLVGGTAAAAGSGRLPDRLQRTAHDWLSGVGVPDPEPTPSATKSASAASARPSRTAPASLPVPLPLAVAELCRLWREDKGKGKKLTPEQRRELAAAAGGEERVPDYCEPPSAGPSPSSPAGAPPGPASGSLPPKGRPEKSGKRHS